VLPERRIEYRVGIHLGDVVEESDGDLMGDGVNIAARLEGVASPGAICLSEQAYWQVKGRLDLKVTDLGATQLKNIAEPIRVYSLEVGAPAPHKSTHPALSAERTIPPRLSIVVLPFANIGGDPEQDYFVDGVTESLTTDLSRIAGAFVIARNTAFTYKGKGADVKQIGRDLNVRYVLEGSVQRGGSRMRVNVQLIDAENGHHLWAERFDKPVVDLFEMQDEIVSRLANQLDATLISAEARRAERAPDPDAFDLYLQGMAWINKGPVHLAQARVFFARALAIEPDNVDALIGAAATDFMEMWDFASAYRAARLASAEKWLLKALAAAPDNALAHFWLSFVKTYSYRPEQGIAEAERALALDHNLAMALFPVAMAKIFVGRRRKTRPISGGRCACRPVILFSMRGKVLWERRNCTLALTKKRPPGLANLSRPTRTFRSPGSFLPPRWVNSAGQSRPTPRLKPGLRLIRALRSGAFESTPIATTRSISSSDTTSMRACEGQGCRRSDAPSVALSPDPLRAPRLRRF
jgi:TolB-like protein